MIICKSMMEWSDADFLNYLNVFTEQNKLALFDNHFGNDPYSTSDYRDCNILMTAIRLKKKDEVILKIIALGGKQLVTMKCFNQCNALHYATIYKSSMDTISKLIEVAGINIVYSQDGDGRNALMHEARNRGSNEVISKLVKVGGKRLINATDHEGRSSLNAAIQGRCSGEVVTTIIFSPGGMSSLFQRSTNEGETVLHYACQWNVPHVIIKILVFIGGKKLVTIKDNQGESAEDYALTPDTYQLLQSAAGTDIIGDNEILYQLLHSIAGADIIDNNYFHVDKNIKYV